MRLTFVSVVAALLGWMASVQAQQEFTFFASIVDVTGAPVASLEPADLRVSENGADATVLKVEPVHWPTKLQILVDNGSGLGASEIIHLRNGLRGLIEALPPGVEVTLVTTAPQPRFLVRGTVDREALMKGLGLLVPDGGTGRFVDSLNEATQRIERDKGDFFPVIIAMATNSGDNTVLDRDVERIMRRLEQRPTIVHVVLYAGASRSLGGGANQTQMGIAVTEFTKGRFENINSATRIASLLPELGEQVAQSDERQSHQLRITAQRPAGASGPLTRIAVGVAGGYAVNNLSFGGRIP